MNKIFFVKVLNKIEINKDAQNYFIDIFDKIYSDAKLKDMLQQSICEFVENPRESFENQVNNNLNKITTTVKINRYSLDFVFLICATKYLRIKFLNLGYSLKMFWDNMKDFKYKNEECYKIKGVYGTFVANWYIGLFELKRFVFERLQFEFGRYKESDIVINGCYIKKDDKTVFIHIPSSGTLEKSLVLKSLKKAYNFFSIIYEQDEIIFMCDSWLLYPDTKEVMPTNSNVNKFLDLFKIIKATKQKEFSDGWRIFGNSWNADYTKLEQKTTMQKCYKKWLLNDNQLGIGLGIFVYDGKEIYK